MADQIGRYEIKSEQGRGGMATVYRAYDPRFQRDVAIKVLPQQFLHDPMFRERFDREARTVAGLEHNAIVPVYDFGEDGGQPYLVMRFMPGGSLASRLKEGPTPVGEAAKILQRVAEGLDQAHKRGITHRDLKPGNILFDQYGDAYLSDFGIAKLTEATAALTGSAIIGTPAYMSPEQARGDPDVDGRSDIYSLGVILFEMLTGAAPYEADTPMGVAIKHILDPVPHILDIKPDLPPSIEGIIGRAMAKDANHRFQTASAMAAALGAVAAGQPVDMPATSAAAFSPAIPANERVTAIADDPQTLNTPPPALLQTPPPPGGGAVMGTQAGAPTPADGIIAPIKIEGERAEKPQKYKRRGWLAALGCLSIILGICGVLSFFRSIRNAFNPNIPAPPLTLSTGDVAEEAGDITSLLVTLDLVGTDFDLYALEDEEGLALEGDYGSYFLLDSSYEIQDGVGVFTVAEDFDDSVEQPFDTDNFELGSNGARFNLGLTPHVPIDLTVSLGGGKIDLDLSGLNLTSLTVNSGAGEVYILLPSHSDLSLYVGSGAGTITLEMPDDSTGLNIQALTLEGGAGAIFLELPDHGNFTASLATGLGAVTLVVPEGLPTRIQISGGPSNIDVLPDRFQELSDTEWETDDYASALERVVINIESGLANITVTD